MPDICAQHKVRMTIGKWAMLASIFKPIILWVLGGVVALGVAGYAIVDSYKATQTPPEVVEKEMPKAKKPVEVASLPKNQAEKQVEPKAMAKPADKTSVATTPEPAPEHPLPKFDILRVETDGYAVIAGSAPAGSKVEIYDGNTIIATETAGSTNEFVVVLDKPLAPGTHDLIILATLEDGKQLASAEAGIVNIPDGKTELMAMVTEPGKASRILQMPEFKKEQPKKEAMPEATQQLAKTETPEVKEVAKKEVPVEAPTATSEPKVVEETKKDETKMASLEQPKETPAAEKMAAKVEDTSIVAKTVAEEAKPVVKVEKPSTPVVPVLIQAAEVEGDKIFIAGTGQSGTSVHIYIDGKFLGKTDVGAEGAYVFEGIGGLDAGRHAVRADMVGPDSTEVMARAVVSLLHEPVAVVPVTIAKVEPAETTAKAVIEKPVEMASEPAKTADKPVMKPAAEPVMKKQIAMAPKPDAVATSAPVEQSKKQPMKVAAVEEKVEISSSAEPAAAPKKMDMMKPAAKMDKPVVKMASTEKTEVAEITTGSSVIIRKGDSLWRVSQRRYGAGVRYTTIFNANRDQIRDPDLIYPGQVFEIPEFKE